MKYAASFLLLIAAAILLLTWHFGDVWLWVWQKSGETVFDAFSLSRMGALDSVLKVAALVLIAAALYSWPSRKTA